MTAASDQDVEFDEHGRVVGIVTPGLRLVVAEDIVTECMRDRFTHADVDTTDALHSLAVNGLHADEQALIRAVEAMSLRDVVLGCAAQVEVYMDVSPIEGVTRAARRFVDARQDDLDAALAVLAGAP